MLKVEQAEQLKNLGLDPDLLKEALLAEEEKEITLPSGKFFADEDIETLKRNVGLEAAEKGANTKIEMFIKELAREQGLELTDKSLKGLVDAVKTKTETELNKKPDERLEGLKSDLEQLRLNKEKELEAKENEISNFKEQLKRINTNNAISGYIPDSLPDGWSKEDLIYLFNAKYSVEKNESGVFEISKDGTILKDSNLSPLGLEVVMQDFLKSKNILSKDGRGDGDATGADVSNLSAITSREQFNAYLAKQGWKSNDPRALAALLEVRKNPNFK